MGAIALSGCETKTGSGAAGVGDSCFAAIATVPEGGFQRTEVYLDVGTTACPSELCVVNHYRGDLLLSPLQGDGIEEHVEVCGPECGWSGIEDRIYCTCKCGVTAGGDPSSIECSDCPSGYECCPLFSLGAIAGDYCVREDTCEFPGG